VAPPRDFSSEIAPFNWRGYWDFGCGAIGDIACHAMDASYTPLKLGFPTRVWAESTGSNGIVFPKASTIHFEFPNQNSRKPLKVTWMDGGRRPKDVPFVPDEFIHADADKNKNGIDNGSIIVGTKGALFTDMYATRLRVFPDTYFRELRQEKAFPEKVLARVEGGHFMEWVDCIKQGKQPGANIVDYAADFTGTALLGAVALAVDERLKFDSKKLQFVNNSEANKLLKSQYDYRKEFIIT
jgi:predicted dehydrogenase